MQDTFVTKEEFDEKYEEICKGIDELKEKYYILDRKVEVIDTKIDTARVEFDTKINVVRVELKQDINGLRTEMNERFNAMNERFNALRTEMNERFNAMNERFISLEKRFMMAWTLMVIILLAIIGLYLRGMF